MAARPKATAEHDAFSGIAVSSRLSRQQAGLGAGTGVYECQRIVCPLADIDGPVTDLFGIWSYGGLIAGEEHTDEITRRDLQSSRRASGEGPEDGD